MGKVDFVIKLDDDSILEHYEELVFLVNDSIMWGKDLSNLLSESEFEYLNKKLIKFIHQKLEQLLQISLLEAELFVHTLCCRTIKKLNLQRLVGVDFINTNELSGEVPFKKWHGVSDYTNDGVIVYYNNILIDKLRDVNVDLIERLLFFKTVTHELIHVKQYEDISNGIVSVKNFLISLENILIKSSYYRENYPNTYLEIDADVRGIDMLFDFFGEYQIFDQSTIEKVKEIIKMASCDIEADEDENWVMVDGIKQDISVNCYLVNEVSKYIKENPELFNSYPLLKLIYKDNGNLCDIKELFEMRMNLLLNAKPEDELDETFQFIIDIYQIIFGSDIIYEEVKMYLENNGYNDKFAEGVLTKYQFVQQQRQINKTDFGKKRTQMVF